MLTRKPRRMWKNQSPHSLLMGMQMVEHCWKTDWQFFIKLKIHIPFVAVIVVQSLSHVWLFATHGLQQVRLIYPLLPPRVWHKFMSIELMLLPNYFILCHPIPLCLHSFQHPSLFQWVSSSLQIAKVLELQHQSFQWIFKIDFL